MIVLKRIIGWETPEGKPESENGEPIPPDVDAARPDFCPFCHMPARHEEKLTLLGHGSYRRWVKAPQESRIRVRRFLCVREGCGKTCSVLPHWVLPRFQYTAPALLASLARYHVGGETAERVTADFGLEAKSGWRTLRRWGDAFLFSPTLWGWLGPQLGVRHSWRHTRQQVRQHVERFLRNFADLLPAHAPAAAPATAAHIAGVSLSGRVFDRGRTALSSHHRHGPQLASSPQKPRFRRPTQDAGAPRGPP